MSWLFDRTPEMVTAESALPGRSEALPAPVPFREPLPDGLARAVVAMGCFWGAEKLFWQLDGVHSTAVGYTGGFTPNPTYEEVCSGRTGHTEAVLVVFDPAILSYRDLLTVFWENHDPTQGMRQGNDKGTQYRSAIFTTDADQAALADASAESYGAKLADVGYGAITTEIAPESTFYYAEAYHQQYLAKNPSGYCPVHATGVTCG